jgi:carboxymethylenebutenolidase
MFSKRFPITEVTKMADASISTEWITLDVSDGTKMPTYVAKPSDGSSRGGLLVFQEAFGVNGHIRDVTERFARVGYTAAAPTLFHRTDAKFEGSYTDFSGVMPHMAAVNDAGQTADIQATYEWLASQKGVAGIAAIGYCMGGRTAFLANLLLPLKATASYYGGGIAPSERATSPLIGRADELHAPALIIWGGLDGHIGPDQRRTIEDALTAAEKPAVHVVFSNAGHGFFCDERTAYEPNSARQAWALTLDFFDTYLK